MNIEEVEVTNDLTIEFDFSKKHLFVYSNNWKVKTLNVQEEKPKPKELPSNKKVRSSKQEIQFDKFIQLFTTLDEMERFKEGVSFPVIRQELVTQGIAKSITEINNLINEAISKDVIEDTERYGFYKKKDINIVSSSK